jgi:carbonic anhydrase
MWAKLVAAHEQTRAHLHDGGVPEHRPRAAVLSCSDARVPPSVIFDQPPGSLFVVRIAGNTATPAALASLDYAVEHLGVELVVVLGHTSCGAVAAAMAGQCQGAAQPITEPICELVARHPEDDADRISARNVEVTVADLVAHRGATGLAARSGRVQIRGALHDLRTGRLEPVGSVDHAFG